MPSGTDCAAVGTDASTGEITAATVASAVTTDGTPALTTCNNTTVICTIGSTTSTSGVAFYDMSGSGNNAEVPTGGQGMIFVVPGGGGTVCPGALASNYCAFAQSGMVVGTLSLTFACPCSYLAQWIDTTGAVSNAGVMAVAGNAGIYSNSGVADLFTTVDNNTSPSPTNTWFMGVGAGGSSGFWQVNANTNVSVTTTDPNTSGTVELAQYNGGLHTLPGYFFKAAFWQNNSGSAAVTHAQAVTAIANTRARLLF
jgi:hypothetical protein